ncbi:M48 family metallopeptidase [Gilvimarinus sp. DA14]|uniref:M48 family metallopeptidase n=1 Tax=Gilvimarinus sp. DA14 TaxID=2956798 RepID=UPI0020B67A13|nr:SprT family zinc-dependent metalloprotease [Gilvimarinus sp. DA14]UTF61649.1 M48 family metallopeptidase [Gilvimarinus sp. DA14]
MAKLLPSVEIRYSSRRRTIGIEVRDAQVVVRAPRGFPESQLRAMVAAKSRWIEDKVARQRQRLHDRPVYQYCDAEYFPYLGGRLRLKVSQGARQECWRDGEDLVVQLGRRSRQSEPQQIHAAVAAWYRMRALEVLETKTRRLCLNAGLRAGKVSVRATRSKWGHCTRLGDIQYNWQILLAPEPVVDYLVAHEVSHLVQQNHSPAFWRQVERLCPGYQSWRQWLREHGHTLILPAV